MSRATSSTHLAEFRPLEPALGDAVGDLFEALALNGDEEFFHPHPLTREEAHSRCAHGGPDIYVAAMVGRRAVGYGMLRGWSEGYEVPSLGIAIHPTYRGSGVARRLMEHLHAVAAERGVGRIRLKVDERNVAARRLYESLGYRTTDRQGNDLVQHFELRATS